MTGEMAGERDVLAAALHETHVCRDCGAEITMPYARGGEPLPREALDLERLATALSFAHPGPRPWPGKLSSAEFARVIARAYEYGDQAFSQPCTYHRAYGEMCGLPEVDPIHPAEGEQKGVGRHVYRHDAREYAALSPDRPTPP